MITLKVCKTPEDFSLFAEVIDKHHSYMDHKRVPMRRIQFLIYENETLIGAIGLSSAVLRLNLRDKYLGFSSGEEVKKNLNKIGNNYRFCLIKDKIKDPNTGTKVLKEFRRLAQKLWKEKYGDDLIGIETFVKPPCLGTVYKADNWEYLGMTKGQSIKRLPLSADLKYHSQYRDGKYGKTGFCVEQSEPKMMFFKKFSVSKRFTKNKKYPGVTFHRGQKKFQARIYNKGDEYHVGYFEKSVEAHKQRLKAIQEITCLNK